jgi:hypothetical protein
MVSGRKRVSIATRDRGSGKGSTTRTRVSKEPLGRNYPASWYSWISPPSRSRRRRRSGSITSASGCSSLSGGRWASARCGRCSLKCRTYVTSTWLRWRRPRINSRSRHSRRTLFDPAFSVRSRLRRPHRSLDHPHAFGAEDLVEIACELAVAVTDEKPRSDAFVAKLHQQVACLLGHPAAVRFGRDPGNVDAARGQLDEEQDVEAFQEERVDGEEVALQDARRLLTKEPAPACLEPLRRRLDPGLPQDRPDGARGQLDPQSDQLPWIRR